MVRPGKDAFFEPSQVKVAEEGDGAEKQHTPQEWKRRLIVDGVEVDPDTMQPLNPREG